MSIPTPPTPEASATGASTTSTRSHPYSAGGAYVNMMMDEGHERVRASYRDNYDRLAPTRPPTTRRTPFRVNQNIEPNA